MVLNASNACIKCKHKALNGTRALCGLGVLLAFGGRKVEGACSEPYHALPESGKPSRGIPESTSLRRTLYLGGTSAVVNPRGQLERDGVVPGFPSTAPSVVGLDTITLACSFSSLEQASETLRGGTVLV